MSQQLAYFRRASITLKMMREDRSWLKRCSKLQKLIQNSSASLVSTWETSCTSARHRTTLPLFVLFTLRPSHSLRSTSTRSSSSRTICLRPANSLKYFISLLQRNSPIFTWIAFSTQMWDRNSFSAMSSSDVFERNS